MASIADRVVERMRARGHAKDDGTPNVKAAYDAMRDAGLKVAYATLYGIVKGETKRPSPDTLAKIADYYGVTVDWLLHGERDHAGSYEQGAEMVLDVFEDAIARARKKLRAARIATPEPADRAAGAKAKARAKATKTPRERRRVAGEEEGGAG